jgi:hypothetical protein
LGDSLPFANALSPIVFNGFEAVGDMSFLIRGLGLVPMFRHWGMMGVVNDIIAKKYKWGKPS